jgi:hypothetical protein
MASAFDESEKLQLNNTAVKIDNLIIMDIISGFNVATFATCASLERSPTCPSCVSVNIYQVGCDLLSGAAYHDSCERQSTATQRLPPHNHLNGINHRQPISPPEAVRIRQDV